MRYIGILIVVICLFMLYTVSVGAQSPYLPGFIDYDQYETGEITGVLIILAGLTVLALAPSILIMTTAFIRIVIVMALVTNAIGTQRVPPSQVVIGLALFLTFFVMSPTWILIQEESLGPFFREEIDLEEAFERGVEPLRDFMFRVVREKDLALFVEISGISQPEDQGDVPTHVLIPAFILSELKTGFQLGFMVFLPFLVVDMIVASILMSMGMLMLPPVMVSLPFKILLFVLVDGWHLTVRSLLLTYT